MVPPQLSGTAPHFPATEGLKHVYGAHAHTPVLHGPSLQSASTLHFSLVGHGPQLPPQSLSVSRPFVTPSSQRAARHVPDVHTPLRHVSPEVHALPSGLPVGTGPASPPSAAVLESGTHAVFVRR